jgi:pilus assembly protein CpaB
MNNTVLKIIAALLAIGAVIVAILGVKLSRQPAQLAVPQASAPASIPTEAVVVAARAIKAGQRVGPADVTIKGLPSPPSSAYRQAQDVTGKIAVADIAKDAAVLPQQLAHGTMASLLMPGERAVAVHVDEVIGLGGFAKPGDHVDVLSYQSANRETNDNTFAQVAVHDARLLAFGDATDMDTDSKKPEQSPSQESLQKATAPSAATELKERRANLRSAVLAVQESDATKLMLASSVGQLRLALRPQATVEPDPLGINPTDHGKHAPPALQRYAVTVSDVSPNTGRKAKTPGSTSAPPSDGIIIQEGSKERRLTKNEAAIQP